MCVLCILAQVLNLRRTSTHPMRAECWRRSYLKLTYFSGAWKKNASQREEATKTNCPFSDATFGRISMRSCLHDETVAIFGWRFFWKRKWILNLIEEYAPRAQCTVCTHMNDLETDALTRKQTHQRVDVLCKQIFETEAATTHSSNKQRNHLFTKTDTMWFYRRRHQLVPYASRIAFVYGRTVHVWHIAYKMSRVTTCDRIS